MKESSKRFFTFWCLQTRLLIGEFKRLHIWLIKYRVLEVCVTAFSCYLTADAWIFFKEHYDDFKTLDQNSALAVFLLAYIGLIKFCLDSAGKKHEGLD